MRLIWSQVDKDIYLDDESSVEPLVELTDAQLRYWLELDHSHPFSPATIASQLSWGALQQIRQQAKSSVDPDLSIAWSRAAVKYAPFTNQDGKWDLRYHRLIHRQPLETWAINEFIVTEQDLRFFVLLDGKQVTAAEFRYLYDEDIFEHFDDHADLILSKMQRAREEVVAPIVRRRVTVLGSAANGADTIEHRTIKVLEGSDPRWWASIRCGEKVLDIEEGSEIVDAQPEPSQEDP